MGEAALPELCLPGARALASGTLMGWRTSKMAVLALSLWLSLGTIRRGAGTGSCQSAGGNQGTLRAGSLWAERALLPSLLVPGQ